MQNIVFKQYLQSNEIDDVEAEIVAEHLPDVWAKDDFEYYEVKQLGNSTSWSEEAPLFKIAKLRNLLDNMEQSGCTHVEIMHHEDHQGYVLTGAKVWRATEEELQQIEDERLERQKETLQYQKMSLEYIIKEKTEALKKINDKLSK